MSRLWAILALVVAVTPALAQQTAVTALVEDANGSVYTNGTFTVDFVGQNTTPGAGPYLVSGSVFQTEFNGGIDSSGNLSISLFDNINSISPTPSQWQFNICSAKGYTGGNAAGQFCFSTLITITGASQNITSVLQTAAAILPQSGSTVVANSIVSKSIERVRYCDQYMGSGDIGQGCNSAIAALPSTGGTIDMPAGSWNFSHTINLTNGVILQCAGSGSNNFPVSVTSLYGTNLVWTGTGGTAISITGGNSKAEVRDCAIDNTGTGAIGIDIEGTNTVHLSDIWIYPNTGFTFGIKVGATSNTVATTVENSYVRGNVTNLYLGGVAAAFTSLNSRWPGSSVTPNIQIGDSTHQVEAAQFIGGTIEPPEGIGSGVTNNIDGVQILNCLSCKFNEVFFELAQSTTTPTTGYAINIPSTATAVHGVSVDNSWVDGAGNANTTFAFGVNFASADLSVTNSFFFSFANPAHVIRAQSMLRGYVSGNQFQSTGMDSVTGSPCVDFFANGNGSGNVSSQVCGNLSLAAGVAFQLGSTVVSSLPAAASSAGIIFYVTDSTTVSAEGQTCAGSSTHKAMAFSDGTQWKCF